MDIVNILNKYEQSWFGKEDEMENKTSYVKWVDCVSAIKESISVAVDELYKEVEHGDNSHRAWLKNKFAEYLATINVKPNNE